MKKKGSRCVCLTLLLFGAAIFSSCSTVPHLVHTNTIDIIMPNLFPDGIVYDQKRSRFLVGSLKYGAIYTLVVNEGDDFFMEPFVEGPALVSVVGLKIDVKHDLLIAAVSDGGLSKKTSPDTQSRMARVVTYNLENGEEVARYDLESVIPQKGASHYLNDMALDEKGILYITDSFSPNVYRIDSQEQRMQLFATDSRWGGSKNVLGLNGIAYLKGKLIVTVSEKGKLFSIDTKTGAVEEIKMDKEQGFDGLLAYEGKLFGVGYTLGISKEEPFNGSLFYIGLDRDAREAKITEIQRDIPGTPTAVTGYDSHQIAVLSSGLNALLIKNEDQMHFQVNFFEIR